MRLWDVIDGEPFMINPRLGILNPRKGKGMAVRRRRRKMSALQAKYFGGGKRRRAAPRRRRRNVTRRRNSWLSAGAVVNPRRRRRRHSGYRLRRRSRRMRRNPSFMGLSIPPLGQVAFAGVGFIAPPMIEGFLSRFLPGDLSNSQVGKYVIRIASVAGLTWLVKSFVGSAEAKMVGIGGGVYVLSTAVQEFVPQLTMGSYVPPSRSLSGYTGTMGWPSAAIPVGDYGSGAIGGTASRFRSRY